jgi:Spy/CpxP family protein refolding chaperone
MQSKCKEKESKLLVAKGVFGCLSLILVSTFGPIEFFAPSAFADNNDGATLPAPVKKSQTAPPAARPQSGDDHANDKSKNAEMGPPRNGDGRNGGMMPPPRHGGSLMQMLDLTVLNLSDDQKQKIQKLRADSAIKNRAIQRQLKENTNQMRDVMFDGTSTDAQIKAKSDEMKKSHEQFADSQLEFFLAIRALLTPEQKLKLKDVRAEIEQRHDEMERHGEHHHKQGPPDGGPGGGSDAGPGDKTDVKKKS